MGKDKKTKTKLRHNPLEKDLREDPEESLARKGKRRSKTKHEEREGEGEGEEEEEEEEEMHILPESMRRRIVEEAEVQEAEMDEEEQPRRQSGKLRLATEGESDESDVEDTGKDVDGTEYIEEMNITEEDERVLAAFSPEGRMPRRTLADLIMEKIREHGEAADGAAPDEIIKRKLDPKVVDVFKGVGKLLSRYTSGKIPKAFKIVPALSNWEDIVFIMTPEQWTPAAMFQATRLFSSNLNARMAQRFFALVLLPRVRQDIREFKRLNYHLYQALKKALYKPAAFYKGILLPICEAQDATLREAAIIGSVLAKVSIPVLDSSVALMKMAEMPYYGATEVFIRTLLKKKYNLPLRVLDAMIKHYARFLEYNEQLPVLWHQGLLTLAQRYKDDISKEGKEVLKQVMRVHTHPLITPEIRRELFGSRQEGTGGTQMEDE